jgi:hypothetical protein
MATPTGAISLNDVQTEFGGVNPIGINEYYRGGGLMSTNNTGVPTSGQISMSQLRGLYRTATPTELVTAISATPYADYRNKIFSRVHAAYGLDVSSTTAEHTIDPYSVGATSITASYSFPTSYVAGALPFLKTSFITFVCVTDGFNGSLASLTVGGVARTMTTVARVLTFPTSSIYSSINYTQVAVGESGLSGLSLSATYTKSAVNYSTLFQVFALPGKWDLVTFNSRSYNTTPGYPAISVAANDILIGTVHAPSDSNQNASGTISGITHSEISRKSAQWYGCPVCLVTRATSTGTATYTTGVTTTGGDAPSTNYWGAVIAGFRCTQG